MCCVLQDHEEFEGVIAIADRDVQGIALQLCSGDLCRRSVVGGIRFAQFSVIIQSNP